MRSSFVLLSFVAIFSIAFSSCGGSSSPNENQEVSQEVQDEKLSPEALGEKIMDQYANALTELAELLKDTPEAAAAGPNVDVLKEKYIQEFVLLGKAKEELEEADRSKVDLALRMGMQSIYSKPAYTNYTDAINPYLKDAAFYQKLAEFNIITQYADFDLLKEQVPEEAQRLGIE